MGKHSASTSSQYLLRMAPDQKSRLAEKAEQVGIPLAEAFRVGAEEYLDRRLAERSLPRKEGQDLVAELRSISAKIERLMGE